MLWTITGLGTKLFYMPNLKHYSSGNAWNLIPPASSHYPIFSRHTLWAKIHADCYNIVVLTAFDWREQLWPSARWCVESLHIAIVGRKVGLYKFICFQRSALVSCICSGCNKPKNMCSHLEADRTQHKTILEFTRTHKTQLNCNPNYF
jgi:hypothetical protein